jgi:DNA-binding MarR family transcriptional regulator
MPNELGWTVMKAKPPRAKLPDAKPPDDALSLGNQLCFAVYSTAHAFNHVYKTLLESLGLTYPQYLVMLTLWEEDDLTVKQIGERLQLDSGTLTPLLKRLEATGLVRRARDKVDERQVRIRLTAEGETLRAKAHSVPMGILAASGRSVEGLQKLKADLIELRDSLNRAAELPTSPG